MSLNSPEEPRRGDKVNRIFRVLLGLRSEKTSWYRIAKDAGVGYSWTYNILKGLENEGIIKGGRVQKPRELFERWVSREDRRQYREYHVQDPKRILGEVSMEYAFTGYVAENLVGHYLFPRLHEIYIQKKDAGKWHGLMTANGLVGKGNVQLIISDEHVFYGMKKIDEWPVVSVQQLIVDLFRSGAECAEAADILLRSRYP